MFMVTTLAIAQHVANGLIQPHRVHGVPIDVALCIGMTVFDALSPILNPLPLKRRGLRPVRIDQQTGRIGGPNDTLIVLLDRQASLTRPGHVLTAIIRDGTFERLSQRHLFVT